VKLEIGANKTKILYFQTKINQKPKYIEKKTPKSRLDIKIFQKTVIKKTLQEYKIRRLTLSLKNLCEPCEPW